MNIKRIILAITFCTSAFAGYAQTTDSLKTAWHFRHAHSGGINLSVGYRNNHMDQLNEALTANGFPALSKNTIWYNLSFNRIYKNTVITELGFGMTAPSTADLNDVKTHYYQRQAFYRIGYNLVPASASLRLYPFIGANFTNESLKIADNPAIDKVNDFTNEILNNSASKRISHTNFGLEFGYGVDYLIKCKPKQNGCFEVERAIPIGIKAGYYLQTSAADWKVEDHSLLNGPDKKNSGVFATLSIGLGYSVKR